MDPARGRGAGTGRHLRLRRVRILAVTSQLPVAGDPGRGRPLVQTLQALARKASLRVLSPVAHYPPLLRPRSYLFHAASPGHAVPGLPIEYLRYPTLPLAGRLSNGLACAAALRAAIRRERPDVVLAYWMYPDAWAAWRVARSLGLPLVAGARGSDLRVRDRMSAWFTRQVAADADRLLVVSQDLGRVAVSRYGVDARRVRAIANGCDAGIFHPRPRGAARAGLGFPADARIVAYVGRLVPEKGLRELVQAMGPMCHAHADLQLAIIGDGPMREALQGLAAQSGLRVHMPGALPPGDVAQWLAAADLLALPSYSEGHPNVLVEALACGRPVVASDVGGIPEVVDASCGLLVPPRDAQALGAALEQALAREWDADALAQRFSRSWDQVAGETLLACSEAVARHSRR